jgi:hypothetical protein
LGTNNFDDGAILKAPLFTTVRNYLLDGSSNGKQLFIFAPYIKVHTISNLLEDISAKVVIVTSWNTKDLLSGSSELALYPYCKRQGFTLYINNAIHLKAYSAEFDDMIVTTANISELGLLNQSHLECAVHVPELQNSDRMYFLRIIKNARHVDDGLHADLRKWYDKQDIIKQPSVPTFDEIVRPKKSDYFLISALPMTRSIKALVEAYYRLSNGLSASDDREVRECVFHDLAKYEIPLGLTNSEFKRTLKMMFFDHPFIMKIDEIINPEAYFGEIKEWIQRNCTDVPVPSRRELTGNVQVLLEWFVALGDGKYLVDIPYSHSQRIRRFVE